LRIWDVEALQTHGGSLRVYACHQDDKRVKTDSANHLFQKEKTFGICNMSTYQGFQAKADNLKNDLVAFLIEQKKADKTVVAYGAAAKGNTLLNYAGVKADLIQYVCDAAPSKQGKFLPGSHIPIVAPSVMQAHQPDIVLILPWNIAQEVVDQHGYVQEWGGQFVTSVPKLEYL
jgi:C-methyltransferase-like protein